MKKTLIFTACAVLGLACGGSSPNPTDIDQGKEIYKRFCVACHGEKGDLALNGAKKFPESILTVEERVLVITNGRNLMTPFKGILNEEEIEAVAAYTVVLSKKQ
jgi:mono/diheme cytochrome c family protein